VEFKTTTGRRLGAVAGMMTLRAATVIGVPPRVSHWMETRPSESRWHRLCKQVQLLIAAHEALTETLDGRLRSLEESAARAEAEVRFMGTLLGDDEDERLTQKKVSSSTDCVDRTRGGGPVGWMLEAASEGNNDAHDR